MDTRNTNERSELTGARRAVADWGALTLGERIRYLELEGYLVMPDLLAPEHVSAIGAELAALPLTATDYSPHKQTADDLLGRDMPHTMAAIALPPTVAFLERLFGDDVLCTSISYQLCEPGHPGIAIHTDALPYGSRASGSLSSPVLMRVLYYLDDLTPECSPFKVVPRSHLSVHADGNPYNRFLRHDEEVMVTCRAGAAVVINQKVFHGNYPNFSAADRRMLAISYRPAWAGPVTEVAPWDANKLAPLPPAARRLFRDPNSRRIDLDVQNRPDRLDGGGAGISPSRWTADT